MLYTSYEPDKVGSSKMWRIYADTHDELAKAAKKNEIHSEGQPGEHIYVNNSTKNKLDPLEVDMKTLVRVIKGKANPQPELETGGVTFSVKSTDDPAMIEGPEESDDETDQST